MDRPPARRPAAPLGDGSVWHPASAARSSVPPAAAERNHGEAGMGRIAALVAAVDEGARLGLLDAVDGENAVADSELLVDRQIHQPARALAADVVVVCGLAAYDTAQRDEAIIVLGRQG